VNVEAYEPTDLPASATEKRGSHYEGGQAVVSNGNPPSSHLPEHTTFDLVFGKNFGERWTASVTAFNVSRRGGRAIQVHFYRVTFPRLNKQSDP
jgi:hypothetical protein